MAVSDAGSAVIRWNWSRWRPMRVGDDGLDHVSVAADQVDGLRPEPLVPLPDGRHGAVLHRRPWTPRRGTSPRSDGPARPARAAPWRAPADRRPGPVAVADTPRTARRSAPSIAAPAGDGLGRLLAALQRAGDDGVEPQRRQPPGQRLGLGLARLAEMDIRASSPARTGPVRAVRPWRARSRVVTRASLAGAATPLAFKRPGGNLAGSWSSAMSGRSGLSVSRLGLGTMTWGRDTERRGGRGAAPHVRRGRAAP